MQQEKKFRWDWCILYWNIFLNFSCDIELKIYTTKYSNLLLIILILVWIVCSTYRKGEILMQNAKSDMSPANLFTVTCHTKWSRSGSLADMAAFLQMKNKISKFIILWLMTHRCHISGNFWISGFFQKEGSFPEISGKMGKDSVFSVFPEMCE